VINPEQLVAPMKETVPETKTLQVLLVEDNAGDARLLREMFSKEAAGSFALTHLTRMSEAEKHLARGGVDIVLLDMGLPDGHGLETLRRARAAAPDVVMIVLTGLEDEALAAVAIKEGAQDYLIKGQIENRALPRALRHAMDRHRMQAETDAMRAHQLQLKDEFLSHVSHELRSPLTSIYSFTSIISDGLAGETNPQQNEYLQIILRNVRQLQSMIEDLLEVTQAQAGKLKIELQSVSLDDAVEYAVATLRGAAKEKEIALTYRASGELPLAYADAMRIRQVLTILMDNAVKYTPDGGMVNVQAGVCPQDPGFLQVEISDSGCGIKPDAIAHIFEHLYQVSDPAIATGRAGRRGLGLGLHIAKELVTRQGGEIWVTSEPLQGSHFIFTIPIFSLQDLIRPIVTQDSAHGGSIAVITVGVTARDGSLELPGRVLDAVRAVLKDCLRPDKDVLLPDLGTACEQGLFFVIAPTQGQGAEIIGKRILSQLARHEELRANEFNFSIRHSFLRAIVRLADEPLEVFVDQAAAEIKAHIHNVVLQGRVKL
jgi:signal transduction histidine kinase